MFRALSAWALNTFHLIHISFHCWKANSSRGSTPEPLTVAGGAPRARRGFRRASDRRRLLRSEPASDAGLECAAGGEAPTGMVELRVRVKEDIV